MMRHRFHPRVGPSISASTRPSKLFDDSLAVWPLMKSGFARLVEHYPHSDTLLNAYAKFACIGEDRGLYLQLRPAIQKRRSAAIWGHSATIASCDGHFRVGH